MRLLIESGGVVYEVLNEVEHHDLSKVLPRIEIARAIAQTIQSINADNPASQS